LLKTTQVCRRLYIKEYNFMYIYAKTLSTCF